MRDLMRDKQHLWYSNYSGKTPVVDEWGNETGEYEITRTNPLPYEANIRAARGEVVTRQFGEEELYDRVIATHDMSCPISEDSVLWVDLTPELDANGKLAVDTNGEVITPHNYVVRRVAKSLTNILIAISKVDVS